MKILWNKFWFKHWNNKLDKFLSKYQHIPMVYLKHSDQFIKIYNKKEYYRLKLWYYENFNISE